MFRYLPIIPLVLVNGAEGTGAGVSTYIPKYNPRDIVTNLRRLLNDECIEPMHPWYRGFKGSIEQTSSKAAGVTYTVTGVIEAADSTTLRISELPIPRWTEDYIKFLEKLKVREGFIEHFIRQGDGDDVDIEVTLREDNMNRAMKQGLENRFKLTSTVRTTNMHLFDSDGEIRKYDTPEKILEEFFKLRLGFYEKRKKASLDNLELHFTMLDNKVRFIRCIGDGDIKVSNRTRLELLLELDQKNFHRFPKKSEESPEAATGLNASEYEYLFSMPISTLTAEMIVELVTERYELKNEVEKIRQTSPRSLWLRDLDVFEKELDVLDQMGAEAEEKRRMMREKKARKGAAFKAAPKKQPKKTAANCQKVENTEGHASEPVVTKRLAPQKKLANKASASTDDIPEPKEAFNINESTSDHSGNAPGMEIEAVKEYQKGKRGRKEPSESGTAKAAASSLAPMHHEGEGANFVLEVQSKKSSIMGQPPAAKQPESSPQGRPKRVRRPTWKVQ